MRQHNLELSAVRSDGAWVLRCNCGARVIWAARDRQAPTCPVRRAEREVLSAQQDLLDLRT
jgi:hypothetical protein